MAILKLYCADGLGNPLLLFDSGDIATQTGGRRSNQRFWRNGSTPLLVTSSLVSNYTTLYVGMAINITTMKTANTDYLIASFMDTALSVQVGLYCVSTDGIYYKLRLINGSGTVIDTGDFNLTPGNWYYVEMKATINNSTGAYEIRVDGQTDMSGTGADTQNTANAYANVVGFYSDYWKPFMDVYITDDSFLGDIRLDIAYPTADSATHSDFTPSTGSDNYALIDEASGSMTDYVSSNTLNHIDTYDVTLASTGTLIHAVQLRCLANKSDGGSRAISPVVVSGTTTDVGTFTPSALNETADYLTVIYEADPDDDAAWTESKIANGEFGFKLTT